MWPNLQRSEFANRNGRFKLHASYPIDPARTRMSLDMIATQLNCSFCGLNCAVEDEMIKDPDGLHI